MVENQKERQIKVLRSDRGGEYFSKEFSTLWGKQNNPPNDSTLYTTTQWTCWKEK
jgi:hypothetical protein